MNSLKAYGKRHPLFVYWLLAFALSWGAIALLCGGLPDPNVAAGELLPLAIVAMLVGPSVAGLAATALAEGRAGLRGLFARLRRWRVGVQWYAVALLAAPLSLTVALSLLWVRSPAFRPGLLSPDFEGSLLIFAVVGGVLVGFCEELGWTGFAVPRLRRRYGVPATGLLLGVVWGAWHFFANLWGNNLAAGATAPALFLAVSLFSFLPPYRVLMVWVYARTESLFVVMVMHASLVAFWQLATPVGIGSAEQVLWYLAWAGALWAGVGLVVLAGRQEAVARPVEKAAV